MLPNITYIIYLDLLHLALLLEASLLLNWFQEPYPLCWWWLIWPIQNDANNLKNDWNPGTWVVIWECSQQELPNEYQYDRVWMIFKNLCILVLPMKVASALEGLKILAETAYHNKETVNLTHSRCLLWWKSVPLKWVPSGNEIVFCFFAENIGWHGYSSRKHKDYKGGMALQKR